MARGIEDFRAEILSKGIQVASHFEVEFAGIISRGTSTAQPNPFQFPSEGDPERRLGTVTVTPDKVEDTRFLTLRCENVSLPDVTVNTIETHRFGLGTADIVPYGLSYLEATATFIGDQNGSVYKYFYDWTNRIMKMPDQPTVRGGLAGNPGVYEVGFKSDIVVEEFKIHAYDWQHNKIYTAVLFDAFPRSILTTALNWAAGDELVRYTVFLSFKDFRIDFVGNKNLNRFVGTAI